MKLGVVSVMLVYVCVLMCVYASTVQQEVLLCLHLSMWTELTEALVSGQPGLSVAAAL